MEDEYGNSKPFYKSTGIMAGLAIIIASVMGMDIKELNFEELVANLDSITLAGLGLVAAYGRLKASSTVTLGPQTVSPSQQPVVFNEPEPVFVTTTAPTNEPFTEDQMTYLKSIMEGS